MSASSKNRRLILVRHGQSEWNLKKLFTGWEDVPLTDKGIDEAIKAGQDLKAFLKDDAIANMKVYTSVLERAIDTCDLILKECDSKWLSVARSWRLNERHYGDFQGQNKDEVKESVGDEAFLAYRRSYDGPPPIITREDPSVENIKYSNVPVAELPKSESLKEVLDRVKPFYVDNIYRDLQNNQTVLVVAHGNSLRALIKYVSEMTSEEIVTFELPTGEPMVLELDENMKFQNKYFL